jgi:hypothetical protein
MLQQLAILAKILMESFITIRVVISDAVSQFLKRKSYFLSTAATIKNLVFY